MSRGTKPILEDSHDADADYATTSKAGYFFKLDGTPQATICDTVGEHATAGVALDKPDAAGKLGLYARTGIYPVQAGGTVAAGEPITTNASGEAVLATLGDYILGYAAEDMSDGGQYSAYLCIDAARKLEMGTPTITVGSEDCSNAINVALQFTDELGNDVDQAVQATLSLHDDAAGQTDGTAHSTSPAIGADGLLQVLETDLVFLGTSESDGDLDIDFVDSGAQTIYLKVTLPDGRFVMSDAITHAS